MPDALLARSARLNRAMQRIREERTSSPPLLLVPLRLRASRSPSMHSHSSARRRGNAPAAAASSASSSSALEALDSFVPPPAPLPTCAPSQLFRVPSTAGPDAPALTFASLPRIVLQLVYGYLSLDELGIACRTCRDTHQTAALFRCPINTVTGGIRVRWIGLEAAHGWAYMHAVSRSPLRLHPTIFNSLDAAHGWLSSPAQIALLRRFPHLDEIHCHYSPDVPVDWAEQLEKLALRTPVEDEEDAAASSAADSDALPALKSVPAYLRNASSSSSSSAAIVPSPLTRLQLCPLSWDDIVDAQDVAAAAAADADAAAGGKQSAASRLGGKLSKTIGGMAKKLGLMWSGGATTANSAVAAMPATATASPASADDQTVPAAASSSVADGEHKESPPTVGAAADATPIGPKRRPVHHGDLSLVPADVMNPPHNAEPTLEQEATFGTAWTRINADLFSRLGSFRSLIALGLTLRGDPFNWSMDGFAALSSLESLELEVEYPHTLAFGRCLVEVIEHIRDVPYRSLQRLHSPSLRSIHLRQFLRPPAEGQPDPPVWSMLREWSMESSPVPPSEQKGDMATARAWERQAQKRFWPESTAKPSTKEKSWLDKPDAEPEVIEAPIPQLSADDAIVLMTSRLPRLRSADLLSFAPSPSSAGLALLSRMHELDTLCLGGTPLSMEMLAAQAHALNDGDDLIAHLAALNLAAGGAHGGLHSALDMSNEIVEQLGKLAHKPGAKIDRLTLAYVKFASPAPELKEGSDAASGAASVVAQESKERAEASAASSISGNGEVAPLLPAIHPFTTLLSFFSETLLDLTLEQLSGVTDCLAIAQCTRLETLQLIALRGLNPESLRELSSCTRLFSLRVVDTVLPRSLARDLTPPSQLLPALQELIAELEPDPAEDGGRDDGAPVPFHHQAQPGLGAYMHHAQHMPAAAHLAHLGGGGGGGMGVGALLQPAFNWLTNLLVHTHNIQQAANAAHANDDEPPELHDEEESDDEENEYPEVD